MSSSAPRCSEHPVAPAGWHCASCARALCADCTALAQVSATRLELCVHCDAVVPRLQVPGSARSYRQLLRAAASVEVRALLAFAVGATLLLPLLLFGALYPRALLRPLLVLFFGALSLGSWAFLFCTLLHGCARTPDSGSPTLSVREDLVLPTLRALPLALGLLAPPLLWDAARSLTPARGLVDPVSWGLLLAGSALAPAGVLGLALGEGSGTALRRAASRARLLGADYLRCALGVALLALFAHLVVWTARPALAGGGLLHALYLYAFAALALLMVAPLTGLLLHAHAPELGLALGEEYRRPALTGVRPRGVRRAAPPPAPLPTPREPLALAPQPSCASGLAQLMGALAAGDDALALAHYAPLSDADAALLSVESHLTVGRAAARTDLALAVRALQRAAGLHPSHPEAPRACVLLARLYAERLGDLPAAQALFAQVVERYPDTPAAQFAQVRLREASQA